MKITSDHIKEYEALLETEASLIGFESIKNFIIKFREAVEACDVKRPMKCEATSIFCRLMRGEALRFVCDVIYKYADDTHIATLHRALLKKYTA